MKRVAARKTRLVFETDDFVFERGQNRQIVIEALPSYCILRVKGSRRRFAAGYAAIYHDAVDRANAWARKEKAAAAKAKKAARK